MPKVSVQVILSVGSGNLLSGFPQVTVQIWTAGRSLPEQSVGRLPPAPELIDLYQTWQSIYHCLCNSQCLRSNGIAVVEEDGLEIDEAGVTNVSQVNFESISHQLCHEINRWLSAKSFLRIERHLRSQMHPEEDIRIILETNDELLRHLPWHKWELFQDYPKADIALSQSEYKYRQSPQRKQRRTTKILAVLGNSTNIDIRSEREFLQRLPNAETTFLVNPSCQEFNTQLWNPAGWDILFFAGHSQTEDQTGRLYINENPTNNSITIEKLEEALKASIERGLMLTIFNSCDGLGLALALERLHIPIVVVMREPVPNQVAQEFLRYFLEAFVLEELSFNQSMRQSCRKLQGLEAEFPGASWLPISCQNPAVNLPTWLEFNKGQTQRLNLSIKNKFTDNQKELSSPQQHQVLKRAPESSAASDSEQLLPSTLTLDEYQHIQNILSEFIGPIATTLLNRCDRKSLTLKILLETLSSYLPSSQLKEVETKVDIFFQTENRQTKTNINHSVNSTDQHITKDLAYEYERILADFVGPIASILVQRKLAEYPNISKEEFVKKLSSEIPDSLKSAEFKKRVIHSG